MIDNNIIRCESCGIWTYFPEFQRLMGEALVCKTCLKVDKSK